MLQISVWTILSPLRLPRTIPFLISPVFTAAWYKTTDFSTTASQNRFSTFRLSLHKETMILFRKWQKTLYFFISSIFYYTVEQSWNNIIIWHICWVSYIHHFVMQPLQNPPLCIRTPCFLLFCRIFKYLDIATLAMLVEAPTYWKNQDSEAQGCIKIKHYFIESSNTQT